MARAIVVRDNHEQNHDPEHNHDREQNHDADADADAVADAHVTLIGEVRQAIQTDQLVLQYQPKATLVSERVEAVEALVCWRHPRLGLLYPDSFLPLVEQTDGTDGTDGIDELGGWVLQRALDDLRNLGRDAEHLSVAVNVSAGNLMAPGFADLVERSLAQAQIRADRLVVEITEAALFSDPEGAREVLVRLDALGVKVSIDDFGCGQTPLGYQTSLRYLSSLPIHELKIDRSFIGDMLVNPTHAAIVHAIVDLGHDLDLRIVGEGVESDVVWEILRALGCDAAQGYVLARPMPVEQLGHWLENAAHESYGLVENSILENSIGR